MESSTQTAPEEKKKVPKKKPHKLKGRKWPKAQLEKRLATLAANKAKREGQIATCDVKGAIIELRKLRLRIVADLKSDRLAFPGELELGILNALQCLQGENK